ncbi:unnamed protein product, partial [Effrenium voratum]
EESKPKVPFMMRPSVGTWCMPRLDAEKVPAPKESTPVHAEIPMSSLARKASVQTLEAKEIGPWMAPTSANFCLKGLGNSAGECCEVERVLTKALFEMNGELEGEYFALSPTHPLCPGGITNEEKKTLESKSLLFPATELAGRGVYLTESGELALWLNAGKHVQVLVNKSVKDQMPQKLDAVVSALRGPLCQDGYQLSN